MNFMNRKMFQRGGASNTLGAYQIRDKVTGEVYDIKPDFINTFGFNPYKILLDDTLEKGSAVQSILEDFQEKDAPKIGSIQARQDIGSTIADVGFRVARQFEPIVRGGIRAAGEITGIEPLKKAGGEFTVGFLPEGEKRLGQPFGVLPVDSVIPSDQERARFMLRGITVKEPNVVQDVVDNTSTFDFRDEDMRSKVGQLDFNREQQELLISKFSPEDQQTLRNFIDPKSGLLTVTPEEIGLRPIKSQPSVDVFNQSLNLTDLTTSLEELTQERQDLEERFAEEDVQRPAGINVDEITNLLNEVSQPSINLEKTEAESLMETVNKFDGLTDDQLKFEIDKQNLPGMDALDENKEAVAKQVEVIKKLESEGIDPDEYLNKAINIGSKENYRNDADKKLNQPGFFGTDRFLNFVRNVGAGLVETGQLGPGLALGAAKAAEEKAARDLAEDERQKELELARIAAGAKEKLKPKENIDLAGQINADYNEVVSANNTLEIVGRVEEIILNEDTTSAQAIIQEIFDAAGAIFNTDGQPDPEGKGWNELSPRVRAKVLLNQIKQKNIRDILGESGKTISNLDRQIVDELVGSLQIFKTDAAALEALKLTREGILTNMSGAIARLKSNYIGMENYGDMSLIQNDDLIDYMETGNLEGNPYANDFVGSTKVRPGRINKITLAKD
jgi:hypothetical protein|tara:strand:- start:3243 stop:5264 length:2022 start_codon:yes stop_codon:yes gene_type:complete